MTTLTTSLAATIIATGVGAVAHAGGYLWIGAEYGGKGNYYRYNIVTGEIDLTMSHAGGDHWNNMAADDCHLYLGNPTTQNFVVCDATTGVVLDDGDYPQNLSGHCEDGAYNPDTGTLWRMTYSSLMHETTTSGDLVNTYNVGGGWVGLAWANGTLYVSNYQNGVFARIAFDGSTATPVTIPFDPKAAPAGGSCAGLAYDRDDDVFYMVCTARNLYIVDIVDDVAFATFVVNLADIGYPSNALADGMGWARATCRADQDFSGTVDPADLAALLAAWGECDAACPADLTCDGEVGPGDLATLLASWGDCAEG